tara:strand:+ start:1030 stop:1278 length:249 start_codon:yes stop_codon:yes gene_type:complete
MNYQLTTEQKHAVCADILKRNDEGALMVLLTQRANLERWRANSAVRVRYLKRDVAVCEEIIEERQDVIEELRAIINDHGIEL